MRRPRASAIWLAIVRFQIKSNSRNSSAPSCAAQRLGQLERMAGRANRFVGFLGVLDLRLVHPRLVRQILAAVLRSHQLAGGLDRHLRQVGRVGTHVSDVAVLVQALGHLHRAAGGEAELAVGFLLQRAGGERRRTACVVYGLSSTTATRNSPLRMRSAKLRGRLLVEQQQLAVLELAGGRIEILAGGNLAAVDRDQLGFELLAVAAWRTCPADPTRSPRRTPSARRSRSTISRTATLCTRPAESFGRTLRHNSGETS